MKSGLTSDEVIISRNEHGSNEIVPHARDGFFKIFISTLGDPIIKILLIALAIKVLFLFKDFDWYETVGIVLAIFMASFISSVSEYGSGKAFDRLQSEASRIKSRVRRDNSELEILINEIVVGDVIRLQVGDQVPADGEIVSGQVFVNESCLNGEMEEVLKKSGGYVYRSSVVCEGDALMVVDKVGCDTFYGKLALEVASKRPDSPLKIRLSHLAGQISKLGYAGALLLSFSYLFSVVVLDNNFDLVLIEKTVTNFNLMFGYLLNALTLSVTIIVVAVPEGLPMMITLVLSSNMRRMLKDNVLVRNIMGIETAGNINILFTDKTGTITKGKFEVVGVSDASFNVYHDEKELCLNKSFYDLARVSMVANNASNYDDEGNAIGGNITDRALLGFFNKPCLKYDVIDYVSFSSDRKYSMTSVCCKGEVYNLVKGAPEVILKRCSHYYDNGRKAGLFRKDSLYKKLDEVMDSGVRVIALAMADSFGKLDRLTLVGFVYIKDEVRPEAVRGLSLINSAHINTVMITGDNEKTAMQIGKEVGLISSSSDIVLTSDRLNRMTDDEVRDILPNLKVIARSLPQDKSRMVRIAQEASMVVGMTGDGVNDAPALKKADVGFAMGSGTEVAKEASDVVILDDNLLSISNAILYGRTIFKSIRKFIIFQLTVNLCAVSVSIVGPFIGVDTPVTVIQMLWINMVMDTFAGIAFAFEPALEEYMYEKPKKSDEMIINDYMKQEIFITGIFSSLLCVVFLKSPFVHFIFGSENSDDLMTAFFGLFIFMSVFNCFNARTHRLNLFANIMKNKVFLIIVLFILVVQVYLIYYGGSLFRAYGLSLFEFEVMVLIAFLVVPVDFLRKLLLRLNGKFGGV